MKPSVIFYLFILCFLLNSCLFEEENEETTLVVAEVEPETQIDDLDNLQIDDNFNFQTTKKYFLDLEFQMPNGNPLPNITFNLIDSVDNEENVILTGLTDKKGKFEAELTLGGHIEEIWVQLNFIGMPTMYEIELNRENIAFTVGGSTSSGRSKKPKLTKNVKRILNNYQTLGSWNSQGVPDYLIEDDQLDFQFLQDINVSLPEGYPVPTYNSQYLKDIDMNTRLSAEADIWVTFVHEGAGYKNVLGYFTYDLDNPPVSVSDINSENMYIIFPNVSFSGSGGGLSSGNKVHLGRFPANTGIGWFLIPNGWQSGNQSVGTSNETKYSTQSMNTYAGEAYRQYLIQLKDDVRELLLLGFEDITRPGGDNDFNDAIFYVTASPYSAIQTDDFESISTTVDTDGDGVQDYADEFPNDPNLAISHYTPAKNKFGTLAFEDLWPTQGDYDFNDLVYDYNVRRVMSANYVVDRVEITGKIKAIGALYKNGFGIEFPITPDKINSITGNYLNEGYTDVLANGCEADQDKAVVILFENASKLISKSSGSNYTNVERGKGHVEPFEFMVTINLEPNVYNSQLNGAPYNPFMIVNKNRGKEIHLSGYSPTAKADSVFFNTDDDKTDLISKFYKTESNLPWAVHMPVEFEYPSEGKRITQAHLKFADWAQSSGTIYGDWYLKRNQDYRHDVMIYKK